MRFAFLIKKKLLKQLDILVARNFSKQFYSLVEKMLQSLKSRMINAIKRINTKYFKCKVN